MHVDNDHKRLFMVYGTIRIAVQGNIYYLKGFKITLENESQEAFMENKREHKMIFTLGLAAAFFLLVFVLIEFRENYLAIGATGILLLVAIYFYLRHESKEEEAFIREEEENVKKREEYWKQQMQEFQKIGKAVYTAVKKNGMAVEENLVNLSARLDAAEEQLKQMTDIIEQQQLARKQMEESTELLERIYNTAQKRFEIQKNGLKAVIKYNKENARQIAEVVNSALTQLDNDLSNGFELVHEEFGAIKDLDLSSIDEKYEALSQVVLDNTVTVSDNLQRINDHVDQVEDLLKDLQNREVSSTEHSKERIETLNPLYEEGNMPIDETPPIPFPEIQSEDVTESEEEETVLQTAAAEQRDSEEELLSEEGSEENFNQDYLIDTEEVISETSENLTDVEEPISETSEDLTDVEEPISETSDDLTDAEESINQENDNRQTIVAQEAITDTIDEPEGIMIPEEAKEEIALSQEGLTDSTEPLKEQEIETEIIQTEIPIPEPVSAAEPNQKMTPEQIAALIASLNN